MIDTPSHGGGTDPFYFVLFGIITLKKEGENNGKNECKNTFYSIELKAQ